MDVIDWILSFLIWQIGVLPYIAAVSFGLGMILAGFLFFSHVFWPEIWEEDERSAD